MRRLWHVYMARVYGTFLSLDGIRGMSVRGTCSVVLDGIRGMSVRGTCSVVLSLGDCRIGNSQWVLKHIGNVMDIFRRWLGLINYYFIKKV